MSRGLQAAQHELEKQKITDNLKKNLEHRPEREELVERKYMTFTRGTVLMRS
jgi:RPEL repeat